jgi:hypothetical protein
MAIFMLVVCNQLNKFLKLNFWCSLQLLRHGFDEVVPLILSLIQCANIIHIVCKHIN